MYSETADAVAMLDVVIRSRNCVRANGDSRDVAGLRGHASRCQSIEYATRAAGNIHALGGLRRIGIGVQPTLRGARPSQ